MSSELLKEANRSLEKEISWNPISAVGMTKRKGAIQAWDHAIRLIEKYEEPKGLLYYVPSKMSFTIMQKFDYNALRFMYSKGYTKRGAISEYLTGEIEPATKSVDKLVEVLKVFMHENEVEE